MFFTAATTERFLPHPLFNGIKELPKNMHTTSFNESALCLIIRITMVSLDDTLTTTKYVCDSVGKARVPSLRNLLRNWNVASYMEQNSNGGRE